MSLILNVVHVVTTLSNTASQPRDLPGFINSLCVSCILGLVNVTSYYRVCYKSDDLLNFSHPTNKIFLGCCCLVWAQAPAS